MTIKDNRDDHVAAILTRVENAALVQVERAAIDLLKAREILVCDVEEGSIADRVRLVFAIRTFSGALKSVLA